eukprot:6157387-Prymnesium_polylepis.1
MERAMACRLFMCCFTWFWSGSSSSARIGDGKNGAGRWACRRASDVGDGVCRAPGVAEREEE